jgi:hypothetical protein
MLTKLQIQFYFCDIMKKNGTLEIMSQKKTHIFGDVRGVGYCFPIGDKSLAVTVLWRGR